MTNEDILAQIHALVDVERQLRGQGRQLTEDERQRLRSAEEHLDQLWDLLRRRDAARATGGDPSGAQERPARQVESYLQ